MGKNKIESAYCVLIEGDGKRIVMHGHPFNNDRMSYRCYHRHKQKRNAQRHVGTGSVCAVGQLKAPFSKKLPTTARVP